MKRRIGMALYVLATLLCIGVIWLWVRSGNHDRVLLVRSPAGHASAAVADRGGILLVFTDLPYDGYVTTTGETRAVAFLSPTPDQFAPVRDALFDPQTTRAFLGFKLGVGRATVDPQLTAKFTAMNFPDWFLVLLTGVVALCSGTGVYSRWCRKRRGLCLGCGYDVRASTSRCPECGLPIGVGHPCES